MQSNLKSDCTLFYIPGAKFYNLSPFLDTDGVIRSARIRQGASELPNPAATVQSLTASRPATAGPWTRWLGG